MNTANRSFLALVAIAVIPYLALGMFACGVVSLTLYRLGTSGWSAVSRDEDLLAAIPVLAIVMTGTLLAAWSVVRQLAATRQLAAVVETQRIDPPVEAVAAAERTGVRRLDVLSSRDAYSFTYGIRRPRVAVTAGFVETATDDELEAILRHEGYHVRNRDTLKVVVARAFAWAFFFLPALGHLRTRYLDARELAADRAAMSAGGTAPLAGALYKSVAGPAQSLVGAAAALSGADGLDARVAQLERGTEPPLAPIPPRDIVMTIAALALTAGAAMLAGLAVGNGGGMSRPMGAPGSTMAVIGPVLCAAGWALAVGALVRRLGRGRTLGRDCSVRQGGLA